MIFASSGNMLRRIPKRFITVSSKQYVIGESVMTSIFSHGSPFKILRAILPGDLAHLFMGNDLTSKQSFPHTYRYTGKHGNMCPAAQHLDRLCRCINISILIITAKIYKRIVLSSKDSTLLIRSFCENSDALISLNSRSGNSSL